MTVYQFNQYINKEVGYNLFVALILLSGFDVLFAFIAELEDLQGDYQLVQAIIYSCATFPRRCYEFIPIASLLGCLIGMGGLAKGSELVVMQAVGVSRLRLILWAIYSVIVAIIVSLILAQWVVPKTEHFAQSYQIIKQGNESLLKLKGGYWHRTGNEFFHISALGSGGELYGITRYIFDANNKLKEVSYATTGVIDDVGSWILKEVQQTEFKEDIVRSQNEMAQYWSSALTPGLLALAFLEPSHLSISGLSQYTKYLHDQGLNYRPYRLSFWQKVSQPLVIIVMIILGMAFIFGPLRSVTVGLRVVIGLVVGLLFHYMQQLFGFVSLVFHISPIISALLPVIIFSSIGMILFWKSIHKG